MKQTIDISVFTPSQMSPEDRMGIFVQRHDLLADAVSRVKDSAETGNKHHLLFVGPRGSGKTLFVSLVVDHIDENPQLAEKLYLAWLNEDETSTTFLDLLLRIYRALSKRYPKVFDLAEMEPLYDLDSGAREEFAIKILLERLGNRTPLIIVENLDRIFQGIGNEGQKKLRAFLQENPIFALVTTAQALIIDLTDRQGPFFGFFQTERLKPLALSDAIELLAKIAHKKQDQKLSSFLNTSKGRARARALHFLTGGNHRVFVVLAQFITHDTIENLVKPFLKMVDELTPYYQERIRALPDLQCKIVEYLCTCVETVPVKAIARRMLATHQTVSSQLKDLRAKGYVKSHQKGREFLYEVSEPMMRICVEVKENQTRTMGLLVDFIRVWFEAGELATRKGQSQLGSLDEIYYSAACERFEIDGNLRQRILVDGIKSKIEKSFHEKTASALYTTLRNAPEELALATECLMEGNKDECLKILSKSSKTTDPYILNCRGILYAVCGENQKALADYTAVIELQGAPTEQMAKALFNRGVTHGQLGDSEKAIADCTAVIELQGAPTEQMAMALVYRGVLSSRAGHLDLAEHDFQSCLNLEGLSLRRLSDGYHALAELRARQGRWDEAFDQLNEGLLCGKKAQSYYVGDLEELIGILSDAGVSRSVLASLVGKFLRIAKEHEVLAELGDSLVRNLGQQKFSDAPLDSTLLGRWGEVWIEASKAIPELEIQMRMLRSGIAYLSSKDQDEAQLLNLKSEERYLLRQTLGLDIEEE